MKRKFLFIIAVVCAWAVANGNLRSVEKWCEKAKKGNYLLDEQDSTKIGIDTFFTISKSDENFKKSIDVSILKKCGGVRVYDVMYHYWEDNSSEGEMKRSYEIIYSNDERFTRYHLFYDADSAFSITKTQCTDTIETRFFLASQCDIKKLYEQKVAHLRDSIKCVDWVRLMGEGE